LMDMVASCAGTHSSSAAACQCGSNHNRWRQTLTKTSVGDWAAPMRRSVISSLVMMTIRTVEASWRQTTIL